MKRGGEKNIFSKIWHGLLNIPIWQLIAILLIAIFLFATFLRLNNVGAVERRRAVIVADEQGVSSNTLNALYELQRYTSSHMNADGIPEVYLKHQYERDVQKIYDEYASDENPNGNIFAKADAECKKRYSEYSTAYVQCVASEQEKYAPSDNLSMIAELPSADNYRHAFAAPLWSPDFAGWTFVFVVFVVILVVTRICYRSLLYFLLKNGKF